MAQENQRLQPEDLSDQELSSMLNRRDFFTPQHFYELEMSSGLHGNVSPNAAELPNFNFASINSVQENFKDEHQGLKTSTLLEGKPPCQQQVPPTAAPSPVKSICNDREEAEKAFQSYKKQSEGTVSANAMRNAYNYLPKYHIKAFFSPWYQKKVRQLVEKMEPKYGPIHLQELKEEFGALHSSVITMGKLKDALSPRSEERGKAGARAVFRHFYRWYSRKNLKIDLLTSSECRDYHVYFEAMSKLIYLPELKDTSEKRKEKTGTRPTKKLVWP